MSSRGWLGRENGGNAVGDGEITGELGFDVVRIEFKEVARESVETEQDGDPDRGVRVRRCKLRSLSLR
jgi:hypothetical protein